MVQKTSLRFCLRNTLVLTKLLLEFHDWITMTNK
jgi:hypothetical protein